jgi:hypothetical protein
MRRKEHWILRLLDAAHRGFEIALGVVLGVLSIIPAGSVVWAIVTLLTGIDGPPWAVALAGVVSSLLTWFCVVTAWRLVTGRERPGGGLLHPWFLYAAAFLQMGIGAGRGQVYGGPEYAQPYNQGAAELIAMARSRQQRRRTKTSRSPSSET